jgi:hypothetical protein
MAGVGRSVATAVTTIVPLLVMIAVLVGRTAALVATTAVRQVGARRARTRQVTAQREQTVQIGVSQ